MVEFFLAFIIMLVAVTAMAVGVLNGRAPIAGTCGGLNNMGESGACELCGGDMSKCESSDVFESANPAPDLTRKAVSGQFHDASDSTPRT